MKRYVLANIKIPIVVNENGMFDMLNQYTQTEITSLNILPTIEEEDNLYRKIMEFLSRSSSDLEEPVKKIRIKEGCFATKESSEGSDSCEATKGTKERVEECSEATKESSEETSSETKEANCNTTVEQVITICANNIKMRKHSDNMTFKNIKPILKEKTAKGAKTYTRKTYF